MYNGTQGLQILARSLLVWTDGKTSARYGVAPQVRGASFEHRQNRQSPRSGVRLEKQTVAELGEIRGAFMAPKVQYRRHNRPPPVSVMDQVGPIYTQNSCFLMILFNIIPPPMPKPS